MKAAMDKLKKMREEVRRIDREIIRLVGKRLELTRDIGSIKKAAGLPLLNYGVEKAVIENARAVAKDLNLPADFVKSVMQLLINESRTQQERLHYSAYSGEKETILIVGGAGEMGRWLATFFEIQGHEVLIYDIVPGGNEFTAVSSLEEGLKRASCVVISVSLDVVPETIDKVAALNFKGLIFDIASIKGHLVKSIHNARQRNALITSIHPMFGPNVITLSDKVIGFCDCGSTEALNRAKAFFKDTAVREVDLDLYTHDKAISYVLGLSHIINIIYMKILSDSGFHYSELKKIASTTFLSQMITSSSVINENPELYYLIQKYNPFKEEIFDKMKHAMTSVIDYVLNDEKEEFVQSMQLSREWLNQEKSSGKE